MKKPKCKTCGGKVNSHNYCNACLTFAQPEAQTEHKCSHCNGKGYNTAFQDNVPADGWEARGLPQMAAENVKVPCPKCGGCGQYMIDVKCDCRPQPTEQKECPDSDHLNHKDCLTKRQWGLEAARAANKAQAKLVKNYNAQCWRCNLGEPKEFHGCEPYPQPTDGLIDWGEKELESFLVAYSCYYSNSTPKTYEFNQKNKEKVKKQASNFIRQLLTEQKQKTREDTIDECLTVLRSFKDKHFCLDCNKKEFLPSLKALKSKKQ